MPDIAMCTNKECTSKSSCYRFKAVPSKRQSYCDFKQAPNGVCDYYYPITCEKCLTEDQVVNMIHKVSINY